MKKDQSTPKLYWFFTNLRMQLLHWISHLELSGGRVGEHDIGQRLPVWVGLLSIPEARKSNDPFLIENQMKRNIQLTKLIRQLLHWMSHLELSGGRTGEHDIGQMISETSFANSTPSKQIINKKT